MVHVLALPGTPFAARSLAEIEDVAVREATLLAKVGFDAIIIENMHDRPYVNAPHGPETVAAMTRVGLAIRRELPRMPLGVQVLSFGHLEALAIAMAIDGAFIRVENFVFAHVADEGLLADAAAGRLLRERARLGATHVRLMCDIKKKHASHALTADVPLKDAAKAAEFFGADGLIVTGTHTGTPTDPDDLRAAKDGSGLPVWVGSGVTPDQVRPLLNHADALIVGSSIKKGGAWCNPIDAKRAEAIINAR
ncbi:MAG: BtpA/SgcQ family protein [Tepidisphaera sp.]|nr:BtpA/SgcQ family protein [Tepidisphaera sp.]